MKKMGLIAVAAVAGIAFASPGFAAVTAWGLDAKSKPVRAQPGNFTTSTRFHTVDEVAKLKAALQKKYTTKVTYCDKDYMLSEIQQKWVTAHQEAKHQVVLRETGADKKTKVVCKLGQ